MKVLAITNLFPNSLQSQRGIFNKQQFDELSKNCAMKVIAPLPWLPASKDVDVPSEEEIDGIETYHPRYFVIPKIGRMFHGYSFFRCIRKIINKILEKFDFDVILATWAYPDAYASALLSMVINKPLVIRVHGTDVNCMNQYFLRERMVRFGFDRASKIIAVTKALKEKIVNLGIPEEKIDVVYNGVNTSIFKPMDQRECQEKCGMDSAKKHVLFVGNLVSIKGIEYLIESFKDMSDDIFLHIIGDGDLRAKLEKIVREQNQQGQIYFHGKKEHDEIAFWLNAVDVFCLPSLNEGCPNVILESLACGTAVVGTRVGGIPELIDSPEKGLLVELQNPSALRTAIKNILQDETMERLSIKVFKSFSWADNALKVQNILESAVDR